MQTIAPKEQIDFETNKRLLNRYRFIELGVTQLIEKIKRHRSG